jgi:hypothetical protein
MFKIPYLQDAFSKDNFFDHVDTLQESTESVQQEESAFMKFLQQEDLALFLPLFIQLCYEGSSLCKSTH